MKQDYKGYEDSGCGWTYEHWLYEKLRQEMIEQSSREPPKDVDFFDWIEHIGGCKPNVEM